MNLHAVNEWDAFSHTVVVGTAAVDGGHASVEESYDPKSKEHILAGTFPTEKDCHGGAEWVDLRFLNPMGSGSAASHP